MKSCKKVPGKKSPEQSPQQKGLPKKSPGKKGPLKKVP